MRNQNNIKNLTLIETVAYRNPDKANEMLIKNGFPASQTKAEVAHKLSLFILKYKDKALQEIASIHPDRDLLFSEFSGNNDDNADGGEDEGELNAGGSNRMRNKNKGRHFNCCGNADGDYSNCSGCGGSCGTKYSNASGDKAPSQALPQNLVNNREMIAVVGIIAAIAIVSIALSKKG